MTLSDYLGHCAACYSRHYVRRRETIFVRHGRLHYFVREVLKRLRVPGAHASKAADVFVAADLAGIEGEGVGRLPFVARRITAKLIKPDANIKVAGVEEAVATIDGDNGLGHAIGVQAMELAVKTAKRYGVSAVAVRRSNDFGAAGYYARLALEEQLIGVAMSNAMPAMLPTYGAETALGTNPLAIAIPTEEGTPPFVLDMATTATSRPTLEEAIRLKETISPDVALDASGKPTTDPKTALEAMRLLPLGSNPESGSHKGYGLALAVDILSGVLSGGSFGKELAGAEGTHPSVAGIGHFFMAFRIRSFGPWVRFRNRIKEMMDSLVKTPASGAPRVYYPGEAEFAIEQDRRANGIPLEPRVADELEGLARERDIYDAWEHLVEGKK